MKHPPLTFVRPITELSNVDVRWLYELSQGATIKDLKGMTLQMTKNRLQSIRVFLGVKNTTQAVAEAIRRGIIR